MKIISNANKIVAEKLRMDNVVAVYKNLQETLENKYKTYFASSLQVYITKIGIILNECISDINMGIKTFLGSLDFICLKVIKNRQLYNLLRALEINDKGNDVKHDVKNVEVDFELTLQQYNNLITAIVETTKLTAFNKCHLYKNKKGSEKELFAEKRHEKFFNVAGTNFSLSLSPKYTIDIYKKILTTTVTFNCPKLSKNEDTVLLTIYDNSSQNSYRKLAEKEIKVYKSIYGYSNTNDKVTEEIQIECPSSSLNRNVLNIKCVVQVKRYERHYYQEKILLWKKTKCYGSYRNVESSNILLSQIYNPK